MTATVETWNVSAWLDKLRTSEPPAGGMPVRCLVRDVGHMLGWPIAMPYQRTKEPVICRMCESQIKNGSVPW